VSPRRKNWEGMDLRGRASCSRAASTLQSYGDPTRRSLNPSGHLLPEAEHTSDPPAPRSAPWPAARLYDPPAFSPKARGFRVPPSRSPHQRRHEPTSFSARSAARSGERRLESWRGPGLRRAVSEIARCISDGSGLISRFLPMLKFCARSRYRRKTARSIRTFMSKRMVAKALEMKSSHLSLISHLDESRG
jgi:hypothetical protein